MNANIALAFAPRATVRSTAKPFARKLVRVRALPMLRPVVIRHVALAPSACARIETLLLGVTFLALAGLTVTMEAVGASLF
jgi:hypothetical protein